MCFQFQRKIPRLAIALVVAFLLFLLGCTPLYKKISITPPLTTKDTNYLSQRCLSTFKIDTVYKPGEFIFVTTDSTGYWQHIIDSINSQSQIVTSKDSIIYRDTCRSAIDRYRAGEIAGYETGYAHGKLASSELYTKLSHKADSSYLSQLNKLKQDYTYKINELNMATEIANQNAEKYRGQSEKRGQRITWLLIVLAVSIIANILQWKFKRVEKGANTLINTIQDVAQK